MMETRSVSRNCRRVKGTSTIPECSALSMFVWTPDKRGRNTKTSSCRWRNESDLDVSYGLRYNLVTQKDTSSIDTQPEGLEGVLRASIFNAFGGGTTLGFSAFVQK